MSEDMIKAIEAMGNSFKPMDTRQAIGELEKSEDVQEFKKILGLEVNKIKENDKVEKHLQVCMMLNDTYRRKNHDYGDSFGKTFSQWGISSAGVRLSDKFNRFCSLASGEEQMVNDESIKDTLLDMANYCIMTYMELD